VLIEAQKDYYEKCRKPWSTIIVSSGELKIDHNFRADFLENRILSAMNQNLPDTFFYPG